MSQLSFPPRSHTSWIFSSKETSFQNTKQAPSSWVTETGGRTKPLSLSFQTHPCRRSAAFHPHPKHACSRRQLPSKRGIPYVDIPYHPIHSSSSRKDDSASTSSSKRKRTQADDTVIRKCNKGQRKDGTFQTECTISPSKGEIITIRVRKDGQWVCHCSEHKDPRLHDNPNSLQQHYRRAQEKAKKEKIKLEWNVSMFATHLTTYSLPFENQDPEGLDSYTGKPSKEKRTTSNDEYDIPYHPIHSSSSHKDIPMADPDSASASSSSKRKRTHTNQTVIGTYKRSQRTNGSFQTECTITDPSDKVITVRIRKDGKWVCRCSEHKDPLSFDVKDYFQQHYRRAKEKAAKKHIKLNWNSVSTLVTPNDIPHSPLKSGPRRSRFSVFQRLGPGIKKKAHHL
jgi:hypothetical protein